MSGAIGISALLLMSQVALAVMSPKLAHAAVKDIFDVAPLVGLLSAPALMGLFFARSQLRQAQGRWPFCFMIGLGFVMRLVWFGAPPPLEDDFYRYLWDGAVVAAGVNPYALSPEEIVRDAPAPPAIAALAAAGKSTLDHINFPEYTTIYPGAAQVAFAAAYVLAPWSVGGLRIVFLLADVAALGLVLFLLRELGQPRIMAGLFWCNPLVVLASIAAVHVDALLGPLMLGALVAAHRIKPVLCAALLALAVGVKIWPALLAPLLARAQFGDWRRLALAAAVLAIVAGAALTPLLAAASLPNRSGLVAYASLWHSNNAPFAWLTELFGAFAGDSAFWTKNALRFLSGFAAAATAAIIAVRPVHDLRDLLARALVVAATVFYLSPAQFPWYALWFLPLAAVAQSWPLLLASATLPLYYLFFPLAEMGQRAVFQNGVAFLHAAPVWAWLLWRWFDCSKTRGAGAA